MSNFRRRFIKKQDIEEFKNGQLLYIQGLGGFDPGVKYKKGLKIELNFQEIESYSDFLFFLGNSSCSTSYNTMYYNITDTFNSDSKLLSLDNMYNFRYNIIKYDNNTTINNILISHPESTVSDLDPIYILDRYPGTGYNSVSNIFYSCRIWDNGKLIRDFIPYIKDGNVGILDKLVNKFYNPKFSNNSYTAGLPIILPTNYLLLSYIITDNNSEYIDTGVVFNNDTKIDAIVTFPEVLSSQTKGTLFTDGVHEVSWKSDSFLAKYPKNQSINETTLERINQPDVYYHILYANDQFKANHKSSLFKMTDRVASNINILDNTNLNAKVCIKEFTISKNSKIIKHFIPVLNTSTSKYGLYDIVEQKFYTGVNESFYGEK